MRRALALLHWHMVKEQKAIFVESSKAKVEALEVASRKATFLASVEAALMTAKEENNAVSLGLEGVSNTTITVIG